MIPIPLALQRKLDIGWDCYQSPVPYQSDHFHEPKAVSIFTGRMAL